MKKILTLAAMFAAVMTSFSACEKDGGKDNNRHDDEEEETPGFVSLITADGDFSDWEALDPSKVASCTSDPNTFESHTALKSAKVYADNMYINVLIEYDVDQIDVTDNSGTPVHVYFDCDNDVTTGGYGDEFADACIDYMLENAIFNTDGSGAHVSWDPALFKWWGEANGSGWLWTDPDVDSSVAPYGAVMPNGSGIASGAGDGNGKYEMQILRAMMMGVTFEDTFGIGFDIQQAWSSVGKLPNTAADEETNPNGLANLMKVTIDYTE